MPKIEFARRAALAALFALCAATAAAQQPRAAMPAAAADMGPTREKGLLDAAKIEGEVVVYSTAPPDDNKAITGAFEARYGIPVKLWRGSSEEILQRVMAEAKAGRPQADAFINTGMGLEPMYRENLLRVVASPHKANFLPESNPAHGGWTGFYLATMVQAYNTGLVKKADLPKAWSDLLDPRWKGKLAIEAADTDWFQAVVENLGRDKGLALFRDIVAANKISVRKGHSLMANLVVAGEIPLALTTYQFTIEQMRASGAPIDWFVIPPSMSAQVGVGVAAEPRHPATAALFQDFLLDGVQDLLVKRQFITTRKDVFAKAPFPIVVQDAARALDGAQEWEDLFRKTFSAR